MSALELLMHIFNCPVPVYIFKYYQKLPGDAEAPVGREEAALSAQSHALESRGWGWGGVMLALLIIVRSLSVKKKIKHRLIPFGGLVL